MNRGIALLAAVVAGLWGAAAVVWVNIPPAPNVAACATAVERDTRATLLADPKANVIRTPIECQGFSAAELANIVAATTPIARPRPADPIPTRTDATKPTRWPVRTVSPRRQPTPTIATPVPSTTPSVSPTPDGLTPSPAQSPTASPAGTISPATEVST